MKSYREEHDSMGTVKVPAKALYGPQTQRAVNNFTISKEPLAWPFIDAILLIKICAAKSNSALGVLPSEHGKMISIVAEGMRKNPILDQFPVSIYQTGSGTSTNMNVNEVIQGLIKKEYQVDLSANDHINLGQSSNDVVPSAISISCSLETVQKLLPTLEDLTISIRKIADKFGSIVKTGRTHLMDAVPILLGDELEAWAVAIDESVERFTTSLPRLQKLPLGGTAIGSGINSHPRFAEKTIEWLNKKTGLQFSSIASKFKGQSSIDSFVEFSGNLKTCGIVLSKISNDLRWLNSGPLTGFGEIQLPPLQPGSSIMPAKINPVIPEAVIQAVARIIGNDATVVQAGLGGNFQLNTLLPITAHCLLDSINLLTGSAHSLVKKVFNSLTINKQKMELGLSYNPILATALNPVVGYLKAAEIAKIAQKQKRPVLEIALEKTKLSKKELTKLLDPANLARGNRQD